MPLLLVGINHSTANIALREKLAFPPEIVGKALSQVFGLEEVEEVVIVSTCNRTELYLEYQLYQDLEKLDSKIVENQLLVDNQKVIINWLAGFHNLEPEEILECSYFFGGENVVRHLMKVSCGLDSMVLGEPQILGQIKSALAVS